MNVGMEGLLSEPQAASADKKRGAYKYSNEATCRLLGVWLILALPIGSRPGRRSYAQYTTQVIEVFGYACGSAGSMMG